MTLNGVDNDLQIQNVSITISEDVIYFFDFYYGGG